MELVLATVRQGPSRKNPAAELIQNYIDRVNHYFPANWLQTKSTESVFALREKPASCLILLDSRGSQKTSEELAESLDKLRDGGKRTVILAIGPADGWSAEERKRADMLLSLGKMTLPHELAAAVLAEQVYRACTILAGHPYHCGH